MSVVKSHADENLSNVGAFEGLVRIGGGKEGCCRAHQAVEQHSGAEVMGKTDRHGQTRTVGMASRRGTLLRARRVVSLGLALAVDAPAQRVVRDVLSNQSQGFVVANHLLVEASLPDG